ncbi:hypothetical protein PR001_g34038, partial [Phytophthora rubi]
MVALRARVQDAEVRLEKLQEVRQDLDRLRDRVEVCLSGLVTMLTACGTAARKARRTTNWCTNAWNGTSTRFEF